MLLGMHVLHVVCRVCAYVLGQCWACLLVIQRVITCVVSLSFSWYASAVSW